MRDQVWMIECKMSAGLKAEPYMLSVPQAIAAGNNIFQTWCPGLTDYADANLRMPHDESFVSQLLVVFPRPPVLILLS